MKGEVLFLGATVGTLVVVAAGEQALSGALFSRPDEAAPPPVDCALGPGANILASPTPFYGVQPGHSLRMIYVQQDAAAGVERFAELVYEGDQPERLRVRFLPSHPWVDTVPAEPPSEWIELEWLYTDQELLEFDLRWEHRGDARGGNPITQALWMQRTVAGAPEPPRTLMFTKQGSDLMMLMERNDPMFMWGTGKELDALIDRAEEAVALSPAGNVPIWCETPVFPESGGEGDRDGL